MKKIILTLVLLFTSQSCFAMSYKQFKEYATGSETEILTTGAYIFGLLDGIEVYKLIYSTKKQKAMFSCAKNHIAQFRSEIFSPAAYRKLYLYIDNGYNSTIESDRKKYKNKSIKKIIEYNQKQHVSVFLILGMKDSKCKK